MKKQTKITLGIFLIFYVSLGILLSLNQEGMIYQPFPQDFNDCSDFEMAEKVTYQGTRMYIENKRGPMIVLYHGNAGSACGRSLYANLFTQAGYGYIIVEYAGYSNSSHNPSHELIKKDVENVISYLKTENIDDIFVVGESIGTGFASYHASLEPLEKLLLISPFTDLVDLAKEHFWFYPMSLLVDNALNNIEALDDYTSDVVIIHGTEDDIIPYDLGSQLYESLGTKGKIIPIEGAGHNDLFMFEQTYSAIDDFLIMKQ